MSLLFQHILIGFAASFIGSLPFGVLNLTTVETAVNKGTKAAAWFAFGASIVEFVQALVAVYFSDWFLKHTSINTAFNIIVIPLLIILGLLAFRRDKLVKSEKGKKLKTSSFNKAVILSMINPLSIPFWIFYTTYFHSMNWISFTNATMIVLVFGISLGTFFALLLYGKAGKYIVERIQILHLWLNKIIGSTFFLLALLQSTRLILF